MLFDDGFRRWFAHNARAAALDREGRVIRQRDRGEIFENESGLIRRGDCTITLGEMRVTSPLPPGRILVATVNCERGSSRNIILKARDLAIGVCFYNPPVPFVEEAAADRRRRPCSLGSWW